MLVMIGLGLSETYYLLTKDTFALNLQNPKYIKKKKNIELIKVHSQNFPLFWHNEEKKGIRRELNIRTVKICTAFFYNLFVDKTVISNFMN